MKRGAESQLTKDDIEERYVESEQTSNTGFKKAPEEILKTRVIRALPNRTKPSGAQSNSTNGTTASPLFPSNLALPGSSFMFTSPAAATNSFTRPVALSSDSINSSSSSPFAKSDTQTNPFGVSSQTSSPFSSTQTTTPATAFTFPSSSDTLISPAPSSTSKAFASVLKNSNSNIFGSPAPSSPSSSSNQSTAAPEDDPVLFKYYINLRGLNHSLLDAVSKGIEDDPFADMSGILESYKSTRLGVQKEKDDASASSKVEPLSNSSPTSPSSFFSMPAAASPFGKPPAQGAQSSTSDTSSTPSTTSTSFFFQPGAGAQLNPFGLASSTISKTFNSSNETPTKSVFSTPSQKPSFFNSEPTSSTTTISTTSAFDATSSPFKFGGSTTNLSSPSIFGSSKMWGTAGQPTTSDASNNSSTSNTPTPAASNAVHFQFGSGSSGTAQLQSKAAITTDEKTADDEGSEQATPTTEGAGESGESVSNLLAVHNPHDDEGEGEENEITVHALKVKAYRMRKADAKGGPGWADLGFGILRLKKDKDTNARRMLLRNSTNGKILINFKIYTGLKPSLVKKALTFVGHDNGVSQTYCVRLPGEEQAQQLKEALDKEIESITAKDEQ